MFRPLTPEEHEKIKREAVQRRIDLERRLRTALPMLQEARHRLRELIPFIPNISEGEHLYKALRHLAVLDDALENAVRAPMENVE